MNAGANDSGAGERQRFRLGWAVVVLLVALQAWSRFMPSPQAVLVGDDWYNLSRSSFHASNLDAARVGILDPNRPLSMAAVEVAFRLCGTEPFPWTLLSLAANSLLLLAVAKMTLELTGRRFVAVATGVVFALLPNLVETFHWSTQILNEVTCGLVPYALSGWLWVAYARRGGAWRLAVSALAYGVGLFSYEAGIFLPAAFAVLLPWRSAPARSVARGLPFGLVAMAYLAWRTTNAFGMNEAWQYPPHMQGGLSVSGLWWNARQVAHWWGGDFFFRSVLCGLDSFSSLSPWARRLLGAGNVAAAWLVWQGLKRLDKGGDDLEAHAMSRGQAVAFGAVWTGATLAICLVSYTASRLMVLPAIGISLLAALALERWPMATWGPALFVPVVLAMMANQGTAESYRQAGEFNRRIFVHLQQTQEEWQEKKIVLFDTRGVRQRLTAGLLKPMDENEQTWGQFGNALLFRGYVPKGMLQLIERRWVTQAKALHDVEYGARVENGQLLWHMRYNPANAYSNSMDEVFVVDCLEVSQAEP